ncbi:type II toxin-antitoxin system HicA family toxin [Actinocorallia sp. API 0066]|uniref:type II toxin-antitoxin system HicA family toxin n=1 Tax=Actinocorallia sp. API 0066 TaxID=2896846 RepID=UPI0035ABF561
MKLRDLVRALRRHGCVIRSDTGRHTKWICPCGQHTAILPRHREVSPGVVGDTVDRLKCLPEGWMR